MLFCFCNLFVTFFVVNGMEVSESVLLLLESIYNVFSRKYLGPCWSFDSIYIKHIFRQI